MKGLAELRNKIIKVPHLNIFKLGTWVTMGLFATFLLIYIFVGDEMLNYFPLLILFAFGSPFVSLMMSKATVKRAYNIRMIGESGARTEKEKLVIDTITLFSQKLGLQKLPEIGVYPSNDINAFATGASKNSAMVAVSQGLLNSMNETEIISAYSRRREFGADKLAAEITEPAYMKSALVRLQEISEGRISLQDSDREFASFKITNNFSIGNIFGNIFASHPSLEKRIAAIERMENK